MDNSVTVIGCKRNYGGTQHGVLTLTTIRNQPFVHDSESFQIFMTEEKDENYEKVYQQLKDGFIIPASQQRAGEMQGRVIASNSSVQTWSHLTFYLQPTLDLGKESYFSIEFPALLEFQGPSCTVSESKGFSKDIYCTRIHHIVTIYHPFDAPFVADVADELMMVIEEFMMPTAV